jgi:hypothetical protein
MRASSPDYSAHVSAEESLLAERHEDSVLFSSQAAQSLSSAGAPAYTPGPNPGFAGGEGSGLIDIRALASLTRQTAPRIATPAAAAPAIHGGAYPGANNALSFGDDDDEARIALMNQSSFGRVDSLAPVSTASQTSSVAVPLAIVGGCALVAAAILLAILIVRPSHPPEAVAVGASAEQSDSVAAAAEPTNAEPEAPTPPPTAAEADKPATQEEPPVAVASAEDEKNEVASTKPKRQPHMPRTAAEDKKSGAPEEKAKPKKEEKAEPPSSDEVMLAARAKPRPAAAAAAVAAENAKQEKSSNGAATDIDQLLATKPAKQAPKSRSLDDLLEGADKNAASKSAPAPAPAAAPAAAAAANPAASAADDSELPDSPSRDEILAAMRGVESQVRACAEGQQIQGTAEVALSISGNNGRITNATVNGITGNVGSCIARAVRNAKFPRFKKSNFSIKYPYRF